MMKQVIVGMIAAMAIASAPLVAVTPAQADQFGIYVDPGYAPDNSGCWTWAPRSGRWIWICQQNYQNDNLLPIIPFFGFGGDGGRHFGGGGDHHDHGGGDRRRHDH